MLNSKRILIIAFLAVSGSLYLSNPGAQTADAENTPPADPAIQSGDDSADQDFISASTILDYANPRKLALRSSNALVVDQREGVYLYEKKIDDPRPIASVTKLMTAMVTLDANLSLDEQIIIANEDRDRLRGSRSRLKTGMMFTRRDLLLIALAASENRASKALARTFPGGQETFVKTMNAKASSLGMTHTHFDDASGLNSGNISTARDLAVMTEAALTYELIQRFTTTDEGEIIDLRHHRGVEFINTNRLVRRDKWEIGLSKTGYIADAGHCLVMQAEIGDRPVIIVLLNSWGKLTKFGDSNRVRDWLLRAERRAKRFTDVAQNSG